jgi:hypothetical protein
MNQASPLFLRNLKFQQRPPHRLGFAHSIFLTTEEIRRFADNVFPSRCDVSSRHGDAQHAGS